MKNSFINVGNNVVKWVLATKMLRLWQYYKLLIDLQ
jgi:hypothetical protein